MRRVRFDLDHITPSSRGGETDEFNLFPYRKRRHSCWHEIFLNMQIWDIWENIEDIHRAIFGGQRKTLNRHWLVLADLPSREDLRHQIDKTYETKHLRKVWSCAFRGRQLPKARTFLQLKMLFMIFGSDAVLTDKLFDNGNLAKFFKEFPVSGERKWAFTTCFGPNANFYNMKEKMQKILKQPSP